MSDIARQYPAVSAPGLYSGSAAADTAGSGTVKAPAAELATIANQNKSHDYKDDRTR